MVHIQIEPFELKLPNIVDLAIDTIGSPYLDEDGNLVQLIYQELIDSNGVVREKVNRVVPVQITELLNKILLETITEEEKAGASAYCQQYNPNIILI